MAEAVRTVQKWAVESGLSRSMIDKAIDNGHLECVVDAQPRMVTETAFYRWVLGGRKTEREGRRKPTEDKGREMAMGAQDEKRGRHGDGAHKKGGQGQRAQKARVPKPTLYHPDFGGSLESPGA